MPTVEETLKMLAGALQAAIMPGLEKVKVQHALYIVYMLLHAMTFDSNIGKATG